MSDVLRLYRSILRLHRQLPSPGQRYLGDQYVMAEFRDHVKKASEEQMGEFMRAWQAYEQTLSQQLEVVNATSLGQHLPEHLASSLSEEQKINVDRLRDSLISPSWPASK